MKNVMASHITVNEGHFQSKCEQLAGTRVSHDYDASTFLHFLKTVSTAISRAFSRLNSHLLRLCRVWERVYAPGRVCTVGTFATAFWERPKAAIASRRVIGMSSSDSRTQGMQHRMHPGIHRNAPKWPQIAHESEKMTSNSWTAVK